MTEAKEIKSESDSCGPIAPELMKRLSMIFLMDEIPVMDEKGKIKRVFVPKDKK